MNVGDLIQRVVEGEDPRRVVQEVSLHALLNQKVIPLMLSNEEAKALNKHGSFIDPVASRSTRFMKVNPGKNIVSAKDLANAANVITSDMKYNKEKIPKGSESLLKGFIAKAKDLVKRLEKGEFKKDEK